MFVVFEGPDGSGKTTAIQSVAAYFRAQGRAVLHTREPGGSEAAEAMRELLMQSSLRDAPVISQLLLITAARLAHLKQSIEPALDRGELVLCDRYVDSSFVYQCDVGGVPTETLTALNRTLNIRKPDLRLFFELPADVALSRLAQRDEGNRFDTKDRKEWERLADAYRRRQAIDVASAVRIDASVEVDQISTECIQAIEKMGANKGSKPPMVS